MWRFSLSSLQQFLAVPSVRLLLFRERTLISGVAHHRKLHVGEDSEELLQRGQREPQLEGNSWLMTDLLA